MLTKAATIATDNAVSPGVSTASSMQYTEIRQARTEAAAKPRPVEVAQIRRQLLELGLAKRFCVLPGFVDGLVST
jgi:hypothetical protein